MKFFFIYTLALIFSLPVIAQTVGNKVNVKGNNGKTYKGTIKEVVTGYIVKYDDFDEPVVLIKSQFTLEQPQLQNNIPPKPFVHLPKPGFVSGRVLSTNNQPISGATITVFGFTKDGARFDEEVKTKEDGTYELQVPKEGLYRVSKGYANVLLNDQRFSLPLKPLNNKTELEPAEKGIVADFTLMLSGLKSPDKDKKLPYSYFGQQVSLVMLGNNTKGYSSDAVVKITLTPIHLADNGPKIPITFERTLKAINTDPGRGYDLDKTNILADIPLGVYVATATINKAGMEPEKMLVGSPRNSGDPESSTLIWFRPGTVGVEIFNLNLFFSE